jgi:hypothetical protein
MIKYIPLLMLIACTTIEPKDGSDFIPCLKDNMPAMQGSIADNKQTITKVTNNCIRCCGRVIKERWQ